MPKLIFGCGYLGHRVATRWRSAGEQVTAVTRSVRRAEQFRREGFDAIVGDVTDRQSLGDLPEADTVLYAVGYDPQSGKSRWDVYVQGLAHVLDALSPKTRRIITIGSTGIYGQADGDWVDEESPCRPTREAGQAFATAEKLLREHPLAERSVVLRLAGLYGPGRIPRMADVLAERSIPAPKANYLNLIHVDDAARIVLAAEQRATPPRTYLVADGRPTDRREFYRYLAELLDAAPPKFHEPSPQRLAVHHAGSNKRVRNTRLLDELQIELAYPSYREGLRAIIE